MDRRLHVCHGADCSDSTLLYNVPMFSQPAGFSSNMQPATQELIRDDLSRAQKAFATGAIDGVPTRWLTGVELDYKFNDGLTPDADRREVWQKYDRSPRQI